MVPIVEKLVEEKDKVPNDVLNVPGLIRAATDATALIGAANFKLNMWWQDNIKPNWTKILHTCGQALCHL